MSTKYKGKALCLPSGWVEWVYSPQNDGAIQDFKAVVTYGRTDRQRGLDLIGR